MSLKAFWGYYGLAPPFNFKVATPLIVNTVLLGIVLVVWMVYIISGAVNVWTMRFIFFAYIAALLIVGAVVSRLSIVSYVIASWCVVELSLAFSPITYERRDDSFSVTPLSLLPANDIAFYFDHRFKYHPLMQIVPKEDWQSLSGVKILHNHLGLRGRNPTGEDLQKDMIFIYGGSTAYDEAVDQGETWPEILESKLEGKYAILNFGVPGYSSTESLLQTVFYGKVYNKTPVCAIYYLGWNDIHNAYIKNLDSAYADYHLRYQPTEFGVRKPDLFGVHYSPVLRVISQALQNRFDTLADARYPVTRIHARDADVNFENIYKEHIKAIVAINAARGVTTVFVGQILNSERLSNSKERDSVYGWTPYFENKDIWPFQSHINMVLREAAILNGAQYIDAGISNFTDTDFVDFGHFSAPGSYKFARLLSKSVKDFCGRSIHR